MSDYSYQDMLKMQQDAVNRVREMRKRAVFAVEEDNGASADADSPTFSDSRENAASSTEHEIRRDRFEKFPDSGKRISLPVEIPETTDDRKNSDESASDKNDTAGNRVQKKSTAGTLSVFGRGSRDTVLILALLILLGGENSDGYVFLALMYLLM